MKGLYYNSDRSGISKIAIVRQNFLHLRIFLDIYSEIYIFTVSALKKFDIKIL